MLQCFAVCSTMLQHMVGSEWHVPCKWVCFRIFPGLFLHLCSAFFFHSSGGEWQGDTTRAHTHPQAYVKTRTNTYTHAHTRAHTHTLSLSLSLYLSRFLSLSLPHTHTRTHTQTHTHTHIHILTHTQSNRVISAKRARSHMHRYAALSQKEPCMILKRPLHFTKRYLYALKRASNYASSHVCMECRLNILSFVCI